jgi:MFS family permease
MDALRDTAIETDIPARLDRLPWSRFHWLVVVALAITWILDGLEVTLAGSLAGALKESPVLRFDNTEVGLSASAYLAGAILGSLFFGWLTDWLGRKKLFSVTLGLYLVATAATAFSWDFWSYALFRFLTGAGIGGEYTAINSAIQELIPARYRGRTDLAINGSFWVGAALGALASVVLLDPALLGAELGWRAVFGVGAALSLVILFLRRYLPESPRWAMTHGRVAEAERVVAEIERRVLASRPDAAPLPPPSRRIRLTPRRRTPIGQVVRTIVTTHRSRAVLGLALMATQAFFYNAIFFTFALVLTDFYGVAADAVGWYVLPLALGNFLGPLLLGPLFDTLGRKAMITGTYAVSGLLLAASGFPFVHGSLDAMSQTLVWSGIFFFASAAASAAYLTVSETFPLEIRALAIAIFYAFGTTVGGLAAPAIFGALIDTGERVNVLYGYLLGAALMLIGAAAELFLGVAAERRSLEDIAAPLSSAPEAGAGR